MVCGEHNTGTKILISELTYDSPNEGSSYVPEISKTFEVTPSTGSTIKCAGVRIGDSDVWEGFFMYIEYHPHPVAFFGHFEYNPVVFEKYEIILGPGVSYVRQKSYFVSQTEAYMVGMVNSINLVTYSNPVGFIHSFPDNPNSCMSSSTWQDMSPHYTPLG